MNVNQAARMLICSAYLYYCCDSPVIDDSEYDKLSKYVAKNWDKLDKQLQWQLGSAEDILATGSGIKITQMGQGAAHHWHKKKIGSDVEYYNLKWQKPHQKYKCYYAVI